MLRTSSLAFSLLSLSLVTPVLAQEQAQDKVYLEADTLIDDKEIGALIAEGNVVAKFQSRELSADKIIYTIASKTVRAIGNVRITDEDGSVRFADEVEVDDKLGDGVATSFSAQLPQNATIIARTVNRKGNGTNTLNQAVYTACELCEENGYTPTWSVRARKAEQNADTQMITYQDAVFEIKGVPVLYLPYFAHPDPKAGRRSGLLMPTPGLSSKLGVVYEQPYYWAISKSQDVTIVPKLHTNVNPTIEFDYRKQFYSGRVNANVSFAYDYEFDSSGDRILYDTNGSVIEEPETFSGDFTESETSLRSHIFADGLFDINQDWQWGFGIERASDDLYIRRYNISDQNSIRGVYDIGGQRLLSQGFIRRQTLNSYFDAAVLSVQGLQENDIDDEFGLLTPLAFAEQNFDFGDMGVVSLQASTSVLNRNLGDDTRRFTASGNWENTYIAPIGLVLTPEIGVRSDYYDYTFADTTGMSAEVEDADTRTSGHVAATLSLPVMKRSNYFNTLIEPIVMVAHSESSIENGVLPNEDSQVFEYTLGNAFEANPFSNFDLIETGSRVAAGFRTRTDVGQNFSLETSFARRWRDEADPALGRYSNLDGTQSDYLVSGLAKFGSHFSISSDLRFDEDQKLVRSVLSSRLSFDRFFGSVTYFDLSDEIAFTSGIEGLNINTSLQVTENIKLLYAQNRNIEDGLNASQAIGIEFFDECGFFRIQYQKREQDDRGLEDESQIRFAFGLKTLGQVSDNTFD